MSRSLTKTLRVIAAASGASTGAGERKCRIQLLQAAFPSTLRAFSNALTGDAGAQRGHVADHSRHGSRRREPAGRRRGGRRRRPARHLLRAAAHGRRRRPRPDRVRHRPRRSGRGVGAELARVDRRRARHHDCRRCARPDQHPLQRRRGGLHPRAKQRPRSSPCADSSTPTTRRSSRAPASSCPRSSTPSCSRARPTTRRSPGPTS